ncbi:hypothetical protein [Pontibacter saemangeumensis]|uniref:hypothetical protein n=1 Tax=Pontibacter saemangeumensis TaxID=1084525 RepID=UPI0031F00813
MHRARAGQLLRRVSPHPRRNPSPASFAPTVQHSAKCCAFAGELPVAGHRSVSLLTVLRFVPRLPEQWLSHPRKASAALGAATLFYSTLSFQ